MPSIVPPSRPQRSRAWAEARLAGDDLALLAVRGYYRDSMGIPGVNDRGIYDDAIFVVSPQAFATFNANTDPGRHGINPKIGKPYAVLALGRWLYKKGKHKWADPNGYPAFLQAEDVTVLRDAEDGSAPYEETGRFGINIHKGSYRSTSSGGCLTIWPDQWEGMRALAYGEMDRMARKVIPVVLVEMRG